MKDWPYEVYATGWYQVGYSAELAAGDVRPLMYFDQDLVLFRTEGGEAALLDAYCPHLGAHRGKPAPRRPPSHRPRTRASRAGAGEAGRPTLVPPRLPATGASPGPGWR
jgi:Rieske [2Fe-2S] domain